MKEEIYKRIGEEEISKQIQILEKEKIYRNRETI